MKKNLLQLLLIISPIYTSCLRATGKHVPNFRLERTDAIFRNSAEATLDAISNDGKLILTSNFVPTTGVPEVELFENVHGKLVTRATLEVDPFSEQNGADNSFTNECFTIFGVVDDNAIDSVRVRILKVVGNTFQTIKSQTFSDAIPVDIAGTFSKDGKYVILVYTTNASTDTNIVSAIRLLDAETLQPVFSTTINGLSNGPRSFVLHKKGHDTNYFVVGYANLNLNTGATIPPAALQIYKISHNKFKLVDEVQLTQFPSTYFINNDAKKVHIISGLSYSINPNQPTIYQDTSLLNQLIPGNNDTVEEYSFDGKKLALVSAKHTDAIVEVTNFYKDDQTFGIMQVQGGPIQLPLNVSYLSFYKADRELKACDRFVSAAEGNIYAVSQDPFYTLFSKDGKWLASGGATSDNTATPPQPIGVNNISLFKVVACK